MSLKTIVGGDFRPSYQQVAVLDTETGEVKQQTLCHATQEAEPFYRNLTRPALVGMDAVGNCQWFEQLLEQSS